ncbi:MAG: PiT family inorganic phosphate transporter [Phycisphaerales bacterium]|jgi:PiT family inorganic phosphate transporter
MNEMEYTTALMTLALLFGFYMAWNIGANDVANAMGTSVGSGALTFKRAVILAAILEFAGAFFVGSSVSDTVRKGIVDPVLFEGDPQAFVLGMLSALLAAGVWLQIASYFGWPVSTTHSIVGAIVGFGVVYGGLSAVEWGGVGKIAASWIVSPLMSGTISFLIFQVVLHRVFYRADPVKAVRTFTPYMVFIVLAIMTLVMVFKGLKHLHLDLSFPIALLVASGVGLLGAIVSVFLLRRYKTDDTDEDQRQAREQYTTRAMTRALKHLHRARRSAGVEELASIDAVIKETRSLTDTSSKRANLGSTNNEFRQVERIFIFLQILTACFVAFAHGANDVANAIGPLSAAVQTINQGAVAATSVVPMWALALGGVGIIVGLATYGWRVMETVGKKITELTPSRGFCAEFGAATTIVIASKLALPISTTHTLVGAVLGVGLARGIGAINLSTVRDIALSWVITIPAGALLAIIFYKTLSLIF